MVITSVMQMLHNDDLEICFILVPISAIELSLTQNHRPTADVNNVNFRFLFMKDCYDRIYVNFQKLWRVVQTFYPKKKEYFQRMTQSLKPLAPYFPFARLECKINFHLYAAHTTNYPAPQSWQTDIDMI